MDVNYPNDWGISRACRKFPNGRPLPCPTVKLPDMARSWGSEGGRYLAASCVHVDVAQVMTMMFHHPRQVGKIEQVELLRHGLREPDQGVVVNSISKQLSNPCTLGDFLHSLTMGFAEMSVYFRKAGENR
jgi:hypothetical protein